jgi:hypothetical protein
MMNGIFFATLALLTCGASLVAQEANGDRGKATGPKGFVLFQHARDGGYYVPRELMKDYQSLQAKLLQIKKQLEQGLISGREAVTETEKLRSGLKELREKLDRAKVHVAAAREYRQLESLTLDPSPERLLVITADRVKIVGSDEPKIRIELEKIILSPDGRPLEKELDKIKLSHQRGIDSNLVGKTREERDAEEADFRAKQQGKPLPPAAEKLRGEIQRENFQRFQPFEAMQGKILDHVSIQGLLGQEGNRQITLELRNDDESGSISSVWQRHASMIVYVPKLSHLVVRGGRRGLEIRGVHSSLIVTSDGSHDRDYEATVTIEEITGNVRLIETPLHRLQKIKGTVQIESPSDFANSGTLHENNERFFSYYSPLECSINEISGHLEADFGRVNLSLRSLKNGGTIRNSFGDTRWTLDEALAAKPYRLHSTTGAIRVEADSGSFNTLPVILGTNFGTIRTNVKQPSFEEFSFGRGGSDSRNWHGFRFTPKGKELPRFDASFDTLDRLNSKATPSTGVTITTDAGSIQFTTIK